jgi:hypothetical protein
VNVKLKYFAVSLALILALTICCERPAYGYVDPGSGLLAMQTLSAMFTGALFYFRRRLKSLFKKNHPECSETDWNTTTNSSL